MIAMVLCFLEQALEGFFAIRWLCAFYPDKRRTGKLWMVTQIVFFGGIVLLNAWNLRDSFVSTLVPPATALMWTVYSVVCFKISFIHAFLWELFCNCNYLFLRMLILLISAGIEADNVISINRIYTDNKVVAAIILITFLEIVIRLLKCHITRILQELIMHRSSALLLLAVTEYVLVIYIFNIGQYHVGGLEILTGVLCVIIIVLMLFFQIIRFQNRIVNTEKAATDLKNAVVEQQFLALKEKYESSRKLLHNKKYEMQHIQTLLNQERYDDARAFVENSSQHIKTMQQKNIWTGITEVDIFLDYIKGQCQEKKIVVQIDCGIQEISTEIMDFCVILGNLLDNALEAAQQCEPEKRFIGIVLKSVNEMTFIEVVNTYRDEPILKKDGRFKSRKSGLEHGWGLESVKDIVNRNQGSIEIKFIDYRFYVTILI